MLNEMLAKKVQEDEEKQLRQQVELEERKTPSSTGFREQN